MGQTIAEQRAQADRDLALYELRKARAEAAARLAKIDEKIEVLSDEDFRSRVGDLKVSEMTTREKVETINRIGSEGFEALLVGRR